MSTGTAAARSRRGNSDRTVGDQALLMNQVYISSNPAQTQRACLRLAGAYARRPGAEVPVVSAARATVRYTPKERLEDLDKMLEFAVSWANNTGAIKDNDWPPFIELYGTVPIVPDAFGCTVHYATDDAEPWAKPVISEMSQVWSLKPAKVSEARLVRRQAEWVDFAQRTLGTDVAMWTMDIQSPFSVAAQVADPGELFTACVSSPKAVHHLCRMITDFTIEMMQMHLDQMEHPGFPGRNFPSVSDNIGICIADDTPLIMLSPDMYREFALPYNSELGMAFGGVHLHSCGDYRCNLDNVLAIANIRSIQVHAGPGEFPLPQTAEEECALNRARKQLACLIDTTGVARGDEFQGRPRQHYSEYVLPRLALQSLDGCIVQSCGQDEGLPDASAALRWTRAQIRGLMNGAWSGTGAKR